MDRLEKIKRQYAERGTDGVPVAWLIKQVESSREQIAQMSREIEEAHQALNELGVPNDGKSSLSERIVEVLFDLWTKECNAQMNKHEYNISICQFCKKEVANNWYIRHVKSGCKIGGK